VPGNSEEFDLILDLLIHGRERIRGDNALMRKAATLRGLHDEFVIHFLAVESEYDAVEFLLEQGFDCNVRNRFNQPPLFDAVTLNDHRMVALLLHHGANPNLTDNEGNTALHRAFEVNAPEELRRVLIGFGADPSARNVSGKTPGSY
jgi:ankyrin repeat protein